MVDLMKARNQGNFLSWCVGVMYPVAMSDAIFTVRAMIGGYKKKTKRQQYVKVLPLTNGEKKYQLLNED